jgi:hypothetical protein
MTELEEHSWIKEFPASVTVCDPEGVILTMNDKAAECYEADGGYSLIGVDMLACHPEPKLLICWKGKQKMFIRLKRKASKRWSFKVPGTRTVSTPASWS